MNEWVRFRLFQLPCCGQLLCWLNPRLPNFCPECGKLIFYEMQHTAPISEGEKLISVGTAE
jgi:hypothetical protein